MACCIYSVLRHSLTSRIEHLFNGPLSGTTQVSQYQKGKTKVKQEAVSGSCVSWAICKSAFCPRQITMPTPPPLNRPDAFLAAQPAASKRWHPGCCVKVIIYFVQLQSTWNLRLLLVWLQVKCLLGRTLKMSSSLQNEKIYWFSLTRYRWSLCIRYSPVLYVFAVSTSNHKYRYLSLLWCGIPLTA